MKLNLLAAMLSVGIGVAISASPADASFYLDAAEVRDNPSGGRVAKYFGFTRLLLEKNQDLVGHEAVTFVPGLVDANDAIELKDHQTPMGVLLKGPNDSLMYYDRLVGSPVLYIMGFDREFGYVKDVEFHDPPWARRFIIGDPGFEEHAPHRAPLAEFIKGPPPSITVIPEPTAFALLAGLTCLLAARRPQPDNA